MACEKSEFERVFITNRNYRNTIGESSTITMLNRVFEDSLRRLQTCLQYFPRVVLSFGGRSSFMGFCLRCCSHQVERKGATKLKETESIYDKRTEERQKKKKDKAIFENSILQFNFGGSIKFIIIPLLCHFTL